MANNNPPSAHEEIKDAVFSVFSRKQDRNQVWWISVGLVNNTLGLDWHSFVNHDSIHAKPFCGKKPNAPTCKPKKGQVIPPCVLERISVPCSFRKALSDLETATMHLKSHSQGRISILYWVIKKEAPYISKDEMQFPWLVQKEKVLKELLGESKPPLDSDDPSGYETHAKICMGSTKKECSAALIPLLQHRALGDNAYVGAIALCGTKDSDIWRHLPHIRAVATSLLETRRHLKAVISKKDKDLAEILIDQLLQDLEEGSNLFAGECKDPHCTPHTSTHTKPEQKARHDYECRIAVKADYFVGALGEPVFDNQIKGDSWNLQKSLFCFGKLQNVRGYKSLQEPIKTLTPAKSHATTLESVATFFRKAFGVTLNVNGQGTTKMVWPRKPGLFTPIGLYDVYRELNPTATFDGTVTAVNPEIRASITHKNSKFSTIQFTITLKDAAGAKVIQQRIKNEPQGNMTSNISRVCACMPTRLLVPPSRADADIIRVLNEPAYKSVHVSVKPNQKPPILCFKWDFPHIVVDGW